MVNPSRTWLERYRAVQRPVEVLFWVAVIGLQAALNTAVALVDMRAVRPGLSWWQPVLWELSSHLMVLLLIPAIVAWNRRFPLHWDTLRRHLPWHLAGSVVFSVVHVAGMVAARTVVYGLAGEPYDYGPWLGGWLYEYLKDVRAYMLIVASLTGYRFLLLRLQGEARVLDAPEEPQTATATATADPVAEPHARPERFLVRKLRKEFLIAASDIEWVQAQANYVGLRVNGHDYLLRATMTEFGRQLDPLRFVQVHRSYLVNLDHIVEIEPQDSGDAKLRMRDATVVPCSRRYRSALDPSRRA